jgi:hypothetical protein
MAFTKVSNASRGGTLKRSAEQRITLNYSTKNVALIGLHPRMLTKSFVTQNNTIVCEYLERAYRMLWEQNPFVFLSNRIPSWLSQGEIHGGQSWVIC